MTDGVAVDIPTTERRCENCACYMEVKNPANQLQSQGFCRRDPAGAQTVRVQVPRMGKDGTPALDRQGRVVLESREQMAYVFRLSARNLTCFDGWRPIGTAPGDRWEARFALQQLQRAGMIPEELVSAFAAFRIGPPLTPPAGEND
jgi:hypothetical protein